MSARPGGQRHAADRDRLAATTLHDAANVAAQNANSTTTTSQTSTNIAAEAVRNQAQNAIANTARGGVSTGSSLSTRVENMVPLSNFSRYAPGLTPLSVNHQGPFVATTFSFNLPEGEIARHCQWTRFNARWPAPRAH